MAGPVEINPIVALRLRLHRLQPSLGGEFHQVKVEAFSTIADVHERPTIRRRLGHEGASQNVRYLVKASRADLERIDVRDPAAVRTEIEPAAVRGPTRFLIDAAVFPERNRRVSSSIV